MIIDAWAQHPTLRHSQDPIFESLRRWTKAEAPAEELPVAATIAAATGEKAQEQGIARTSLSHGELFEQASKTIGKAREATQRLFA